MKRLIDFTLSLLMLIILSPVMIIIALIIKMESPGGPIFSQERIGKDGQRFTIYKYRTMQVNNNEEKYKEYLKKYVLDNAPYKVDENGQGVYKIDNTHITKFGSLLRKTNLDELPQLFNILKGDMSLVGPRPDVPYAVKMYEQWQHQRFLVKPGITGLWQVTQRKSLSFKDMVRLDIEYIAKRSLFLDIRILLKTVGIVLRMDGS